MSDFRHEKYDHSTPLSKYIWKLEKKRGTAQTAYLGDKYLIMFHPESATLNKRAELYSTCRHRLKSLLGKFKT